MPKKLTITELIQQKEQLKRDSKKKKRKELYLEQLDATVTIEEPDTATVMDSFEVAQDDETGRGADAFLVYNILVEPNLKDEKLQKEYGCAEPADIVSAIFDAGTVKGIALEAMNLAGYNSKVSVVDKAKN